MRRKKSDFKPTSKYFLLQFNFFFFFLGKTYIYLFQILYISTLPYHLSFFFLLEKLIFVKYSSLDISIQCTRDIYIDIYGSSYRMHQLEEILIFFEYDGMKKKK